MKRSPSIAADHNSGNLFAKLGLTDYRAVASLQPYPDNPHRSTKKQVTKLAAQIHEYGFLVPILVDADGQIIAGETRWLAAREAGLEEVPVIQLKHLTKAQIRAFRIADNKIRELGTWDQTRLASEFQAIIAMGEVSIDLTGFETAEADVIIAEFGNTGTVPAGADPDDEQPEREPAISRTGDLWILDKNRLLCGSSRDAAAWARLMNGATAAMVFTDPPYNCAVNGHVSGTSRHAEFQEASGEMTSPEFVDFLFQTIGAAIAHLKDGGIADVCMDFRRLPELQTAIEKCGLKLLNLCVWNKGVGGMGSLYRSQHELVLITKKGNAPHLNHVQLGKYGRYRTNVWDYPGANSFGKTRATDLADHPTVKPIALVADAIRDVTNHGDIVLDAFMGSGTTLLAAERTKRIGYGIEIDGTYVDVAIRRWEKMTGKSAMLAGTGETLAQVRERRALEATEPSPALLALPAPTNSPSIRRRPRPLAA